MFIKLWIDHCVSNANLHSVIRKIDIIYDFVMSDHNPISVTLDLNKMLVDEYDQCKDGEVGKK